VSPPPTVAPDRDLDPFGTTGLRETVLRTWAASPARFREDANAEELLSLGYGGRVLGELAANGADAARAAGVPGQVAIAVVGRELRVANTGAPLSAAGVAALAALRASAKRDDAGVGHFGVGFTAVRALTDDPVIVSTTGAVRFSAADTARAIAELQVPALDEEVARRHGQLPALRLPWPVPGGDRGHSGSDTAPPAGFVTEVRLPLRPGVDAEMLTAELSIETALDLLWALPDLAAVLMPRLRVARAAGPDDDGIVTVSISAGDVPAGAVPGTSKTEVRRFRTAESSGTVPAELLADRPVEERGRDRWRLRWVVPVDDAGRPKPVPRSMIGAPTPTEEPLGLPARLIGTLPVDESRSRIAPGPLTDFLLAAAAEAYLELVLAAPAGDRVALIPPGGFPLGDLDAALRARVTDVLLRTAFLPDAGGAVVRPEQACLVRGLAGPPAAAISEALPGLLGWPDDPARLDLLRAVGVREVGVSTVTAALAGVDRPATFWRRVYDGLASAPVDDLADLPVPRRGGGTMVGPRGVLLPGLWGDSGSGDEVVGDHAVGDGPVGDGPGRDGSGGDGEAAESLVDRVARMLPRLRMAALDHPLLRRLGAEPADPLAILGAPALTDEIRRRLDDLDSGADPDPDDLHDFAGLVLDLLAAAGGAGGGVLADVLLTDADGEPWPAGGLLLPDAPLAGVLASDADLPVVHRSWLASHGADALQRLGVRAGFGVRRYPAPPGEATDLPDVDAWWDEIGAAAAASGHSTQIVADSESFVAVADLDLVDDDAWPAALAMLAADRDVRDALRPTEFGPSYTAWWLREHALLRGLPPAGWRTAEATDLVGLYDEVPVDLPADLARAIGVLDSLARAAERPAELLRRWADPARAVPAARVPAITRALVAALADHPELDLPDGVRVLDGTVTDAGAAVVLDEPWLAQVLDPARLVPGGADPGAVADVLDLPLASATCGLLAVTGTADPWPDPVALGTLAPAARCLAGAGLGALGDRLVTVLPRLAVIAESRDDPDSLPGNGSRSEPGDGQRVAWWVQDDRLLLDGSPEGIGRAVAHLAGVWADRHALVAAARGDRIDLAESGLG